MWEGVRRRDERGIHALRRQHFGERMQGLGWAGRAGGGEGRALGAEWAGQGASEVGGHRAAWRAQRVSGESRVVLCCNGAPLQVRAKGADKFGTKVEIKNMNSFSNMQKAIEFEFERQVRHQARAWGRLAPLLVAVLPAPDHATRKRGSGRRWPGLTLAQGTDCRAATLTLGGFARAGFARPLRSGASDASCSAQRKHAKTRCVRLPAGGVAQGGAGARDCSGDAAVGRVQARHHHYAQEGGPGRLPVSQHCCADAPSRPPHGLAWLLGVCLDQAPDLGLPRRRCCGGDTQASDVACVRAVVRACRYFPEPDLPPLVVHDQTLQDVQVRSARHGHAGNSPRTSRPCVASTAALACVCGGLTPDSPNLALRKRSRHRPPPSRQLAMRRRPPRACSPQATLPELPAARRQRYLGLGLPMQDVLQLADEPSTAAMFDAVLVSAPVVARLGLGLPVRVSNGSPRGPAWSSGWSSFASIWVPPYGLEPWSPPVACALPACVAALHQPSPRWRSAGQEGRAPSLTVVPACVGAAGAQATGVAPKQATNWICGDIQAYCKVSQSASRCSLPRLPPAAAPRRRSRTDVRLSVFSRASRCSWPRRSACTRPVSALPQDKKVAMSELQISPQVLAEMIQLIDSGACELEPTTVAPLRHHCMRRGSQERPRRNRARPQRRLGPGRWRVARAEPPQPAACLAVLAHGRSVLAAGLRRAVRGAGWC